MLIFQIPRTGGSLKNSKTTQHWLKPSNQWWVGIYFGACLLVLDVSFKILTSLVLVGSKRLIFGWSSEIKYPAVIYNQALFFWKSQIIAQKLLQLKFFASSFMKPSSSLRFLNNQNWWFFNSDFFHTPRASGCLILMFQIPRTGSLIPNFSNYLELVVIKKIKCPPNTGFLTTFHLHTSTESSKFSYWRPMPCLEEYLHFGLSTWLIGTIWMEDKLD